MGSDASSYFIERIEKLHPGIPVLIVDAKSIDINKTFDCIFSNKVLIHLKDSEIRESLRQQKRILNPNGVLLHTFWKGESSEEMEGLLFNNITEERLREIVDSEFEIVEIEEYGEMQTGDSICLILKPV